MSEPLVRSEPLGGSALSRAVAEGSLPEGWLPAPPTDANGWRLRIRAASRGREWLDALRPALAADGPALVRLRRVAAEGGVVVTTGQQPGLFGGPLYTWFKALSALALADELERATGIPCAPVFWAATDDADLAEAATTAVVRGESLETLRIPHPDPHASRAPLSEVPLGDVGDALRGLEAASGSATYPEALRIAREAFRQGQTAGDAYVELLRAILDPYGIAILDAAHPAVSAATHPLLCEALRRADGLGRALHARDAELRELGHAPQVAEVAGLSLVFERRKGERQRVRIADAANVARGAAVGSLGPNVLLRPILERAILPTVAYVAGPAELAYFAQVGAVAAALELEAPLAVPRWSGTIIEPHVARALDRLGLEADDMRDPQAVLGRLARESLPAGLRDGLRALRESVEAGIAATAAAAAAETPPLVDREMLEGHGRILQRRLDRLERRIVSAQKRQQADVARRIAVVHATLFPRGGRQERALNLLPMLARHGPRLLELVLERAREHAAGLVRRGAKMPQPT